ncbi:MAG: nitrous oxide reductase accessory protein NosL [Desulfomonilaceae bacterium]|nr:nitrous oxide reductase accessory protein NosL [Desulfomonilaceae bacterium]
MMFPNRKGAAGTALIAVLTMVMASVPVSSIAAEMLDLPDGTKVDLVATCPVCGMTVGGPEGEGVTITYRKGRVVGFGGVAATVFRDGKVVGFDGARCLFVYNSIPSRFEVDVADMTHQYVTDFVTKKMIEVERAFLVLGSDVKGRMGYEMIPFTNKGDAEKFASEHNGKWIVQLQSVVQRTQPETSGEKTD